MGLSIRGDISKLEKDLKSDITNLEKEVKQDISRLEIKISDNKVELIKWVGLMLFMQGGFIIEFIKFL